MTNDRLFVGVWATGLTFCDRTREENGDYKRIAFLPYSTLVLEWSKGRHPADLRAEIEAEAAKVIARRGESFQIDTCGHTVVLGKR